MRGWEGVEEGRKEERNGTISSARAFPLTPSPPPVDDSKESELQLTSMNDRVPMAILQRTSNLPRELPGSSLPQPPMRDDVVEHLSSAHVLEDHVVMIRMNHHLRHPTDMRMMKKKNDGRFSNSSDFFGSFLGDGSGDEGSGGRRRRREGSSIWTET